MATYSGAENFIQQLDFLEESTASVIDGQKYEVPAGRRAYIWPNFVGIAGGATLSIQIQPQYATFNVAYNVLSAPPGGSVINQAGRFPLEAGDRVFMTATATSSGNLKQYHFIIHEYSI